ncbi:hypothetical protein LTR28_010798, partial [Elasticomyces elasticus]
MENGSREYAAEEDALADVDEVCGAALLAAVVMELIALLAAEAMELIALLALVATTVVVLAVAAAA